MRSFLIKIYLYKFLDGFKLIGVIFTLFFQAKGLNPFQISLLISIWSATQMLLEVPLGMLADRFSRRNLLVIAVLLNALGFGFWMIGGYFFYALGFIMYGIKNALTSGTQEALIYDELKSYGKELNYEKVIGNGEGYFWAGIMLSAIVGGLVAQISFNLVLVLSITTAILSALSLLGIKDVKAIKSTGEARYFNILRTSFSQIRYNFKLLYLIVFICLVFAVYGAAGEYWALIFNDFGIKIGTTGLMVALVYGSFSLAGYTINLFKTELKNLEGILIIISGLLFIIVGVLKTVYVLPLAFVGIYLLRIAYIKFDVKFQHSISSDQRATISSLKSFFFEIIYLISILFFGFIATKFGVISVLPILGGVIISFVILGVILNKRIQ